MNTVSSASLLVANALLLVAGLTAAPTPAADARQRYATLPVPTEVTSFSSIPSRFEGATIEVALTVDAAGNVSNVTEVTRLPADLRGRILPTVAAWKFQPAVDKSGEAVPLRVIYPLHLVAEPTATRSARKNTTRR